MTLTHRPCGACRELVTPAGCRHWKPNSDRPVMRNRQAEYQARKNARDAIAQFRREQQLGVRG